MRIIDLMFLSCFPAETQTELFCWNLNFFFLKKVNSNEGVILVQTESLLSCFCSLWFGNAHTYDVILLRGFLMKKLAICCSKGHVHFFIYIMYLLKSYLKKYAFGHNYMQCKYAFSSFLQIHVEKSFTKGQECDGNFSQLCCRLCCSRA